MPHFNLLSHREQAGILAAVHSIFDRSTGLPPEDLRSLEQFCDPVVWASLSPAARDALEHLFFTWTKLGAVAMEPAAYDGAGRLRLYPRAHPNP